MNIQIIANIAISFSVYLLVLISFYLIYSPTKIFHIAHAAIMTIAPYIVYFLTHRYLAPLVVSVSVGILAASFIGVLSEYFVYRPIRKKKLPSLAYLIASIGIYIILQNIISFTFGDDTKSLYIEGGSVYGIFGAYITLTQNITIIVSLLLFVLLIIFLAYTVTGKSIRAATSNAELCNVFGISSKKIILISFALGSALAGVAGILSAMDTNMTPTFGFNLLLYGVVAMIIGGVGSTRGLLAGSLLVATAQNLAAFYLDTKWIDAITYVILILFLIWKPLGFSGKRLKKVEV